MRKVLISFLFVFGLGFIPASASAYTYYYPDVYYYQSYPANGNPYGQYLEATKYWVTYPVYQRYGDQFIIYEQTVPVPRGLRHLEPATIAEIYEDRVVIDPGDYTRAFKQVFEEASAASRETINATIYSQKLFWYTL